MLCFLYRLLIEGLGADAFNFILEFLTGDESKAKFAQCRAVHGNVPEPALRAAFDNDMLPHEATRSLDILEIPVKRDLSHFVVVMACRHMLADDGGRTARVNDKGRTQGMSRASLIVPVTHTVDAAVRLGQHAGHSRVHPDFDAAPPGVIQEYLVEHGAIDMESVRGRKKWRFIKTDVPRCPRLSPDESSASFLYETCFQAFID